MLPPKHSLRPNADSDEGASAQRSARSHREGPLSSIWSVIVRARGPAREAKQALDDLIRRYEKSVVAMIRALRPPWDQSPEDLKQEFFLAVVRRGDIAKLDSERGHFRSWLHAAVKNFMKNVWSKWLADKNGNRITSPFDSDAVGGSSPEEQFMRQFAEDTLLLALKRHREEAADKARFDRLVRFLPGPQLDIGELEPLAAAYGITRNHLAVQIHLMREKHKRFLREIVADTLELDPTDPEAMGIIELEMGQLYRLLSDVPRTAKVLDDA